MQNTQTIHFLDPSSRFRAEFPKVALELGYQTKVYCDFDELSERSLPDGIIIARDNLETGGIARLMDGLTRSRIWLPVIATAENIDPDRIVTAMKAGALDYLSLPLDQQRLGQTLSAIGREAAEFCMARQKMLKARDRIANLSKREREVLDWLTRGCSNKAIARKLDISPRTVEIHRANMMSKFGASHAADAVRVQLEAKVESRAEIRQQA